MSCLCIYGTGRTHVGTNRNFPKTKTFERYQKGKKIETKYIKMYNLHIQRYLKTAFSLRNVRSHVQLSFAWRYNSCASSRNNNT